MNLSRLFVTAMTLLLVSCQGPNARVATALNTTAALAGDVPIDPLGWRVITSGLNLPDATMYTLFGNESAIEHARTQGGTDYPSGATLSLVTWRQQEDARWFGANIPARPKSVEFVTARLAPDGRTTYEHHNLEGVPLREIPMPASRAGQRISLLLTQRAAVMPE